MTGGGVDFSFECIGNVEVMSQALVCTHKGWGQAIIIGVAGAGEEIHVRPFLLVTGRTWRGTAFGGTRGRTQLPQYVDWYMKRPHQARRVHHRTPCRSSDINRAFDLMHRARASAASCAMREAGVPSGVWRPEIRRNVCHQAAAAASTHDPRGAAPWLEPCGRLSLASLSTHFGGDMTHSGLPSTPSYAARGRPLSGRAGGGACIVHFPSR